MKFTIDKKHSELGDSVKLTWEVEENRNIKNIKIDKLADNLPLSGSIYHYPKENMKYKLVVESKKDSRRFQKRYIRVTTYKPQIEYFYGIKTLNNSVVLNWKTNTAQHVMIPGISDSLPHTGKFEVFSDSLLLDTLRLVIEGKFVKLEKECTEIKSHGRPLIVSSINTDSIQLNGPLFFDIFETDNSNYPYVTKLKVLVVDSTGNYVSGLSNSMHNNTIQAFFKEIIETIADQSKVHEFTVKEVNETGTIKNDIVLALDHSGSMNMHKEMQDIAVKQFISSKNRRDRMGIIKFDGKIIPVQSLTSDTIQINRSYDEYDFEKFGGTTALFAALGDSYNLFDYGKNKKTIVLFSDGYENASLQHFGLKEINIERIISKYRKNNVQLVIVTFNRHINYDLLQKLAMLSGGRIYYINENSDIPMIFDEVNFLLHNHYEISYSPIKDTGFHKINLIFQDREKEVGIKRTYYVGDNFDLKKYIFENKQYWVDSSLVDSGYFPVYPPQTVINFDFDKSEIKAKYTATLLKYVNYLNLNSESIIIVNGHTDLVGSDEYCENLSQQRAESVAKHLIEKGISANRIRTAGYGKSQPLWKPDHNEWQALENRRVEFVIYNRQDINAALNK
jgi:Mg-chelatase subunit ChlD